MIMDDQSTFWYMVDNPGDTPSPSVDLTTIRPGPGSPLTLFLSGSDLAVADDNLDLLVEHSDDNVTFVTSLAVANIDIVSGTGLVEIHLPSSIERYVRLGFDTAGNVPTQGVFSAGVVLPGNQTNR